MTNCTDALTIYDDQVQAFCANTWCRQNATDSSKSICSCPVFNGVGLAPVSSKLNYGSDSNIIVSTYDILQGASEGKPTMCVGQYNDCYGHPCYADSQQQNKVQCHCDVKNGPFLTASKHCGPDEHGRLPNGAPVETGSPGLLASANDILKIVRSST